MSNGRRLRWAMVAAGAVLAAGCADPRRDQLEQANRDNIALREQNSQLQVTQVNLQNEVATLKTQVENLQKLPPDIRALIDQPTRIELDSGTGVINRDGQAGYSAVRLVIAPKDEVNAVVRVPGSFTATAFDLLSTPEPRTLGSVTIPATQCNQLWYETLLGRYYSFEVPLTTQPSGNQVTVRVVFVNAINGETLEAQSVLPVPTQVLRSSPPATAPAK